ncbi:MAG: SMP-30/gluconolactonase/LRE family protein [Verrucomicrobia bacterium]|nr:SMP-30/gluconolactonase/LRE family protein [Verrucomicrobiota bacterium]
MTAAPTMLINLHCELGENPLWNPDDGCLYWEDITGGKIHRYELARGKHTQLYSGERVGGFTFQSTGDLLLFRVNDLALLKPDGRVAVLRPFSDHGMERFNDVIAAPDGCVIAGTIGKTETSGGVFRFDHRGQAKLLWRGTGCSNGMGFSPDQRTFYWTCSTTRRLCAFDYDRLTGTFSHERVLYRATKDEGIPDGLAVDAEGELWSARWDGFALVHHAPDGKVLEKISFPVAKVSSVCFGGAELDQMFLTTAGGSAGSDTLDGAVFQLATGRRGQREFKSLIGV